MSVSFEIAINRILGHEGGYVFDKNDPGGETKWGISKRSYPHIGIKELTREDAIQIYFTDFWQKIKLGTLPSSVVYQMLDFAVNSGINTAIRKLQKAIGVADDGYWGPVSTARVIQISECDLIMLILAERIEFMTSLRNWEFHGKGWSRRIATNLRYGARDTAEEAIWGKP